MSTLITNFGRYNDPTRTKVELEVYPDDPPVFGLAVASPLPSQFKNWTWPVPGLVLCFVTEPTVRHALAVVETEQQAYHDAYFGGSATITPVEGEKS